MPRPRARTSGLSLWRGVAMVGMTLSVLVTGAAPAAALAAGGTGGLIPTILGRVPIVPTFNTPMSLAPSARWSSPAHVGVAEPHAAASPALPSGSSGSVTVTESVAPVQTLYSRGQAITYTLSLNNTGLPVSVSLSDVVPATLIPVQSVFTNNGLSCSICSWVGQTFTVSSFTLAPGTDAFTFQVVALGVDRACSTLVDAAQTVLGTGNVNTNVPVNVCDAGLGYEKWWSYVNQALGAGGTASVNVTNGNLVAQVTDSTPVQAKGRWAYVLRRTYNSQDTANGLGSTPLLNIPEAVPIGAGWRLNLVDADGGLGTGVAVDGIAIPAAESVTSAYAVTLVDADGTHHVFTPNSLNVGGSAGIALPSGNAALAAHALTVSSGYTSLCVDETFNEPAGVHLALWRYVEVNGSCASPLALPSPTVVGFGAMRPDRVRYEFAFDGHLLDTIDGAGSELRYAYDSSPLPGTALGHLAVVYEPRSCSATVAQGTGQVTLNPTNCRAFIFSYPSSTETDVTDPGGRTTQYLLNSSNQLTQVNNVQAGTSSTYHYGTDSACPTPTSSSGQLCAASDLNGASTKFSYTTAAGNLGLQRLGSLIDRKGNTTTFTYDHPSTPITAACGSTTDYVTADRSTERQRFTCIDPAGSVGEVEQGTTADVYAHRTLSFYDTNSFTSVSCIQPSGGAADHDLCRSVGYTLNGKATASDVLSTYNPEGQLLSQASCLGASDPTAYPPAACPTSSLSTTTGYQVEYTMGDLSQPAPVTDTVAGNGAVTSQARPTGHGGTLYVVSDKTQSLTPDGNAAGGSYASYRTTYVVDNNQSVSPNAVVLSNQCPGASGCATNGGTTVTSAICPGEASNSGLLCEVDAPLSKTTRYEYDSFGQKVTMTTPNVVASGGASAVYTYYADSDTDLSATVSAGGWLKAVTDPYGNFVVDAYDQAGNRVRTWDRNATAGLTIAQFPGSATSPTTNQYAQTLYGTGSGTAPFAHPWRYVRSTRDALANTTVDAPDNNGNRLTATKPNGGVTTEVFDANDNLTSTLTSAPGDAATTYGYDAFDNKTRMTDGNGMVTVFAYDSVNRLTTTTWTRGPWPQNVSTVPPSCRKSTSGDAPIPANRILCSSSISYDGVDNTVQTSDGNAQVWNDTFDGAQRKLTVVDPRQRANKSLTTQTVYDADGNALLVCSPRQFIESTTACAVPAANPCTSNCPAFSTLHTFDALDRLLTTSTFRETAPNNSTLTEPTTQYGYDPDGNRTSVIDPNNRTTTTAFNLLDRTTSTIVPRGPGTQTNTTTYGYDPSGNLTATTDGAGRITVTTYDADNRVVDTIAGASSTDPSQDGTPDTAGGSNIRTRAVYDADGNRVALYTPRAFASSVSSPDASYVTNYLFDVDDRPVGQVVPRYDSGAHNDPLAQGQDSECPTSLSAVRIAPSTSAPVMAVALPSGVGACVTGVQYDPVGNRATLFSPAATAQVSTAKKLTYSYTDDNLVAVLNSPDPTTPGAQAKTTSYYDADKKLVETDDPLGNQQVTDYTADELVHDTVDALNHKTVYSPDADGNVVDVTDPTGVDTHTDFYADNRKAEYTQASQDTTGDSYTGAVKNTTAYLYDASGNLVTTYSPSAWARHTNSTFVDPNNTSGTPTANTYSFDNLLLTTTGPVAPDGSVQRQTAYAYDGAGLKTSQHILEVNGSGNPISGKDGGTQTFSYYPDARAQTQMGTDARTVTTQYDPAGDRSQISDSGGPTLSGTYYLDGLARTVSDGTVTSEYAYDGLAQPTAREDVNGSTQPKTTYAYNAAELTSSLHFAPAGSTTITQTPSYDKAGRMTGAATTAGTLTVSYNADNTVALDKVVNGATTLLDWTYLYDVDKRITQQQFSGTGNGGTPNQSTLCYAYDAAGRLNTAFSAAAGTACGTAPAANVTWDHNGNRLTYGGPLTTIAATFAYNADDSIATEQDGTNAVRTYTDANFGGVSSDGCANYNYDGFYRTSTATTTGSCGQATTTFTYDALDRTHTATTGSVTQTLHYDGWTTMTSLAVPSTGTLTSYALSQQGQPLGLQQGSTNQQLFDDGHANVGTVVSTAASVACTARFDPFGTALTLAGTVTPGTLPSSTCNTGTSGSTPNTYFYRSARQDPGTGDYQLGSRLFDPGKDSFLVPDTSSTGSPKQNPSVGADPLLLNTYTYVNGDPVNLVDPDGHRACSTDGPDVQCVYPRPGVVTQPSSVVTEPGAQYNDAHPFSLTPDDRGANAGVDRLDFPTPVCLPDPFDSHTCIPPRLPDYVVLDASAGAKLFGIPLSGGVTITVTRYGDVFIGPEIGLSLPGASAVARAGWILQKDQPSEDFLKQYVGGASLSLSANVVVPGVNGGAVSGAITWGNEGSSAWNALSVEAGGGFAKGHNIALQQSWSWQLWFQVKGW